jgi:1-aminocyclopropane-1-carboxylate deaminase/D-cysteine desulfhydrase-like pyridoxal-dependent ACC family enzyme
VCIEPFALGAGGASSSSRRTHNYTERVFDSLTLPPALSLAGDATPCEELVNLADALHCPARLLVKRDDAIRVAFGGNKVRKLRFVAAHAQSLGADTLITTGSVQSNHARVTAAVAARLRMKCILVVNGVRPVRATANALLDQLLGAEIRHVRRREDRAAEMERAADDARARGGNPFVIPLGASTPLGACAFVAAIDELRQQIDPPDVILHSSSSGGTQAGLIAGCTLAGWPTRVLGISADEPSSSLQATIRGLLTGLETLLGCAEGGFAAAPVEIDDGFVGAGYGTPTAASREAIALMARHEAIFLDPTYTAKAMAGLIARVRRGEFDTARTVLFWHTGGQVGLFA